ncbi:MAG: hypothetical protein NTY88_12075 [Bacteroidetes bacterium]|nr:hypothetical protein [Bacteroidota bacterium]
MSAIENFKSSFRVKASTVFACVLLMLLYRFMSGTLITGLAGFCCGLEYGNVFYHLFIKTGIPALILSSHSVSVFFDFCLFGLPVLLLLTQRNVFSVLFTAVAVIYFLLFNMVTAHFYHGFFAAIIISIPFWTKNERHFNLLWEGVRYYLLYVFASAALWKIFRGSVFYQEQLSNILKHQQLDMLLQQPLSYQASCVQYLIVHPEISHVVLIANVVVQLCFGVGFFTKKFDSLLFILACIFCAANYFVMGITSTELLVLNLTLLNWEKIEALLSNKMLLQQSS